MSKTFQIILVALVVLGGVGYFIYQKGKESFLEAQYVDEPDLKGQLTEQKLTTGDGNERVYQYYQPSSLKDTIDIIYVLHGSGSNGTDMRKQFGYEWDILAEENRFIVVYPTGFDNHWNDCRGSADYQANIQNIDDITFLKTLEVQISISVNAVISRRFATGFSNGGHFCFKLGLEVPDWIDGIAAISANLPVYKNRDCDESNSFVPTMVINGTEDWINPYEGGLVSIAGNDSRGTVLSSMETMNYWTSLGNCKSDPDNQTLEDINVDDNSTIESFTWSCNDDSAHAKLLQVKNGGHTVPHPLSQLPQVLGNTNRDVNAAREIWKFFNAVEY